MGTEELDEPAIGGTHGRCGSAGPAEGQRAAQPLRVSRWASSRVGGSSRKIRPKLATGLQRWRGVGTECLVRDPVTDGSRGPPSWRVLTLQIGATLVGVSRPDIERGEDPQSQAKRAQPGSGRPSCSGRRTACSPRAGSAGGHEASEISEETISLAHPVRDILDQHTPAAPTRASGRRSP